MKLRKKKFNLVIVGIALVFCVACSSSDDDNNPEVLTGQFIDAKVGGVNYKTATQESITNANGEFLYIAGETVVFSIGEILFPSTPAAKVVTPCDIVGIQDTSNTSVVNIARLLQTLDTDGNPDNGITISADAHTASTGLAITIQFDSSTFDNDVADVIANGGSVNDTLIDASDATEHLNESIAAITDSIVGTWVAINNENDVLLFTFFDNGKYIHAEVDLDDQEEDSGMEWGTYTRDQNNSGLLTVSANIDTNGDTGLADGNIAIPFAYTREENDVLTFTFNDEDDLVLNKVSSTGIIGTWLAINDENDLLMFTFLDDGRYLHLEVDFNDSNEISGMELGTYQRNENTGLLTISQTFDENGDTGLTDFVGNSSPHLFAHFTSDSLTFSIDDNGDNVIDDTVEFVKQ